MRRYMLLAAMCAVLVMALATTAFAQTSGPSGADGTYNCEDFDFQEDAQAFYDQDTSDPDGLDGPPGEAFTGEQGVACEDLPSRGTGTDLPEEPAAETPIEPDDGQYGVDDDQYETAVPEADSNTVSPTAETVVLPETGGPSPAAFALSSLALLVAGGIFAFGLVRR